MTKLLKFVGGILVVAVLLLAVLRVVGFDPSPTRPGLWLRGELVTTPVTDWTFALKVPGLTGIQTRQSFFPALAHSVLTTRFVHKGKLYLASGYPAGIKLPDGRHWNKNVMADPRVRIRLGDKLYDRKLVYLPDSAEREDLLRANGPMYWSPGFFLHVWRVEPLD